MKKKRLIDLKLDVERAQATFEGEQTIEDPGQHK